MEHGQEAVPLLAGAALFVPGGVLRTRRYNVIVEIQCLPTPAGTPDSSYRHVEPAIAVIERSWLYFEVGALGTAVEGKPERLWPLLRQVHEACLTAGAGRVITVIKLAQAATGSAGPSMDALTGKFRN